MTAIRGGQPDIVFELFKTAGKSQRVLGMTGIDPKSGSHDKCERQSIFMPSPVNYGQEFGHFLEQLKVWAQEGLKQVKLNLQGDTKTIDFVLDSEGRLSRDPQSLYQHAYNRITHAVINIKDPEKLICALEGSISRIQDDELRKSAQRELTKKLTTSLYNVIERLLRRNNWVKNETRFLEKAGLYHLVQEVDYENVTGEDFVVVFNSLLKRVDPNIMQESTMWTVESVADSVADDLGYVLPYMDKDIVKAFFQRIRDPKVKSFVDKTLDGYTKSGEHKEFYTWLVNELAQDDRKQTKQRLLELSKRFKKKKMAMIISRANEHKHLKNATDSKIS